MLYLISFSNRCVTVDSIFTNVSLFCFVEGCTLTANEHHGVRFCPMEMVNKDLEERNVRSPRLQVLGSWMARLTMWQLGLGEALFEVETDMGMCDPDTFIGGIDDLDLATPS